MSIPAQPEHIVGLDLGQAADYSALTVLEKSYPKPDPDQKPALVNYVVGWLHRWSLGTSYTTIVDDVAKLVAKPPLKWPLLAVDQTGVGAAVIDMFRKAQLPAGLQAILITAGHQTLRGEDRSWHVPKKELVSSLQVLLQSRRLKIARLPQRTLLEKELSMFRVKVSTATGHESFEAWRERDHDDLVLSVALACWLAQNSCHGPLVIGLPEKGKGNVVDRAPEGVFLR